MMVIWNLRTTFLSGTVSGEISDDKSDTTYKVSLHEDAGRYKYEFFLETLGEFKSKSRTNKVTGGINAVMGSAQKAANVFGANISGKFKIN